jgi:hypothetical protein
MAVNLTLLAINGSPYHNSIIDSGTTALIDENIPDHVKIAELTGFDPSRIPPSGSYKIVVVEDYGGRFEVIQESGKWYLVGIGGPANFDYEDLDYAGEFPGITFQFRDSNDTNNSGTVYQQLAVGVRLNRRADADGCGDAGQCGRQRRGGEPVRRRDAGERRCHDGDDLVC